MAKRDGLNVKFIERLKEPGKYSDGRNLYLHVGPNGGKSWLFIYRRLGKDKMRGLGSYRHVGLDEAREMAGQYRAMLRQGEEPPKSRGAVQKKDQGRTFAQLNERYLTEHQDSWREPERAARIWRNSLRDYAYKIIGEKDVKDIDVKDMHAILSPIWLAKHPLAKKVRWRLGAVLAYAAALDLRDDIDLTRSGGKLDKLLPKAKRVHVVEPHESMSYTELPVFMGELRKRPGVSSTALEFLILTGARTGEVLKATWDQMDLDEAIWNLTVVEAAIAVDGLIDFMYGLPAPYRQNSTWLMSSVTAAALSKLKDTEGNLIWREGLIVGQPATLLGRPVEIDEGMPAPTAGNLPVAFGDFNAGYLINDRQGVRVLRDPYTNKPFVNFYSTKRVGGGLLDPNAIRLLKIPA